MRIGDLQKLGIKVELTHLHSSSTGRRAQLRIVDDKSNLLLLQVELTPEQFYNLLSGHIDGEVLAAEVPSVDDYEWIGKRRWWFRRQIGHGVTQETAEQWTERVRFKVGLDTARVDSRQGGMFATWERWSNELTHQNANLIQQMIDNTELPEGAK